MLRRLPVALAAVATVATTAVPAALATTHVHSFTFYAKPTRAQFINHSDDRARGNIVNPFNADVLPIPPKANTGKKGARAGDNGLFSFTLYSDAALKRRIGTAIYYCTFNFAHQALCEADFEVSHGSMIALGPANLDGGEIVLPVTTGTGRYASAHGQVTSTSPNSKSTQVFRFQLL